MSSAKRRVKRKIAMLVRMDATRSRMYAGLLADMIGPDRESIYWKTCMTPLGKALKRRGLSARAIIEIKIASEFRIAAGGRP